MKFKLDENLPLEIAGAFEALGHEIDTVQSEGLVGAPDIEILNHARAEGRILLTMDKGIADVRIFPPAEYPGIVLFRPSTSGCREVLRFVQEALTDLLSTDIAGRLVIVSPRGIRTR
jgi:predicted nuclease of predicted toxin-antitoxin system